MVKKISTLLLFVTMVLVGLLLYLNADSAEQLERQAASLPNSALSPLADVPDSTVVTLQLGEALLAVEVVNTPASVTQGLSGRSEIGRDGMLFVLPERKIASFWMKEMLFDLDMVWIDGDEVVRITADVPAPAGGLSLSQLPSYSSSVPVTSVLEVPAGTMERRGLVVGQKIELVR